MRMLGALVMIAAIVVVLPVGGQAMRGEQINVCASDVVSWLTSNSRLHSFVARSGMTRGRSIGRQLWTGSRARYSMSSVTRTGQPRDRFGSATGISAFRAYRSQL